MIIKTIIYSFLILISSTVAAQSGFLKVLETENEGPFQDMILDNDTIVTYSQDRDQNNHWGIRFSKYDTLGTQIQTTIFADSTFFFATSLGFHQTLLRSSDGGYLMCGANNINETYNLYIIKLSHNLDIEFVKTYYQNIWELKESKVIETESGFFLLGLESRHDRNSNYLIIKTDKNGNEIWRKVYGNLEKFNEGPAIIREINPNKFIIIGGRIGGWATDLYYEQARWAHNTFFFIDSLGNQISEIYETDEYSGLIDYIILPDKSWVCAASTWKLEESGIYRTRPFIFRMDSSFNIIWSKEIAGKDSFINDLFSVKGTTDGNFIVSGTSFIFAYHYKFSPYGEKIWERYDRAYPEQSLGAETRVFSTEILPSGNIISAGAAKYVADDPIKGGWYALLMKITPDGCINLSDCKSTNIDQISKENLEIQIFPNPTHEYATFTKISEILQKNVDIKIYDVMGKHIQDLQIPEFEKSLQWNVLDLPNGVYFCQMYLDGELFAVEKLIKQ